MTDDRRLIIIDDPHIDFTPDQWAAIEKSFEKTLKSGKIALVITEVKNRDTWLDIAAIYRGET